MGNLLQTRLQAEQRVGKEKVQMFCMDLVKGVRLYPDSWNLIDMFGLARKENAASETVRQGAVLIRIDYGRVWKSDGYFSDIRFSGNSVQQGEVQVVRNHPQDYLDSAGIQAWKYAIDILKSLLSRIPEKL